MLVDTNILIDVLNNEPIWADWSIEQLRDKATGNGVVSSLIS